MIWCGVCGQVGERCQCAGGFLPFTNGTTPRADEVCDVCAENYVSHVSGGYAKEFVRNVVTMKRCRTCGYSFSSCICALRRAEINEPVQSTQLIPAIRYMRLLDGAHMVSADWETYGDIGLQGHYRQPWDERTLHYKCNQASANTSLFKCLDQKHECGIWSLKYPDKKGSYTEHSNEQVMCNVLIGGEVLEGRDGYRSSWCSIEQIEVLCSHTLAQCTGLIKKYGVPVACSGEHLLDESASANMLLYGSYVRTLLAKDNWRINDKDAVLSTNEFFRHVTYFEQQRGSLDDSTVKWTVQPRGHGRLSIRGSNYDATIVDDVGQWMAEYPKTLDITANGVVMWQGKLIELIPGAKQDIRDRMIRIVNEDRAFMPVRLAKMVRMVDFGWKLHPDCVGMVKGAQSRDKIRKGFSNNAYNSAFTFILKGRRV